MTLYVMDRWIMDQGCAPLSAVVSKASAGAAECIDVHAVGAQQGGLPDFLLRARGCGWRIAGATDHPTDRQHTTLRSSELQVGRGGNLNAYTAPLFFKMACASKIWI